MGRQIAIVLAAMAALVLGGTSGAHSSPRSFHLRFDTEFSRAHLGSYWTRYHGRDGCCRMTYWAPSHLVERGGVLTMNIGKDPAYGNKWIAAGMSQGRSLNQTYGWWSVRFRMTRGAGTAFAMLLWPKKGWPPEIDFAEEGPGMGARRSILTSTLHYGRRNAMIHHHIRANFTKWHTVGVKWTPGRIAYRLDGHTWAVIRGSEVPRHPMHLSIQTEVGPKGGDKTMPTSSTPSPTRLQINWVRVYRYR